MRIKERLKTHVVEDVKERIRDSRLTPVVVTAVTTAIAMQLFTKQPKININIHVSND